MNSFDLSDYFILINLGPVRTYPVDIFENKIGDFSRPFSYKNASTRYEKQWKYYSTHSQSMRYASSSHRIKKFENLRFPLLSRKRVVSAFK